jgi:hypothetical protein
VHQLFFIIGTGRCGSTYLYDILQAHENVCLTNESKVFDFLFFMCSFAGLPPTERSVFPINADIELHGIIRPQHTARFAAVVQKHAKEILLEFFAGTCPDKTITHWGDKLPNAFAAHAAAQGFPGTKYLVLIRDPRATFCSVRAYAAREDVQQRSPFLVFERTEDFCSYWNQTYRGALDYLPDTNLVRYEDLIATPLPVIGSVLGFLGLSPSDATQQVALGSKLYLAHGTSKDPGDSLERWRRDLDPEDLRIIESECGELMAQHGYPPAATA